MDLTVVTVCRNAGACLEETIKSALSQQGVELKYIVIDGASTDGTTEVLDRYRDKIACVVSEPDRGIYDAMNKGLARAEGDLIFFLNAKDSFADGDVCRRAVAAYQTTKADILYGDVLFMNAAGGVKWRASYRDWDLPRFLDETICHQAVFASREAFARCGNFSDEFKLAGDLDWILSALRRHRLRSVYLPFPVTCFDHQGLTSGRNTEVSSRLQMEMNRTLDRHFNQLERWIYSSARRCRVRKAALAWRGLAALMRWNLSA